MTTHKMTITAGGMAQWLIAFMEGDNWENQKFAREQIHALCQFYEDNKPEEEEDVEPETMHVSHYYIDKTEEEEQA